MSKQELLEKLRALSTPRTIDIEASHGEADDLLIEFINDPEIKEAYDAIEKWYA